VILPRRTTGRRRAATTADELGRSALGAAVGAAAVATIALIGWILDEAPLRTIVPGTVTMKVNTAVCVLGLSAALALRIAGARERVVQATAGVVVLLAGTVLLEWILGVDLGVDQLVIREAAGAVGTPAPGRMAPNTSVCLMLTAAALVLRGRSWRGRHLPSAIALTVIVIASSALFGYAVGVPSLFGLPGLTGMAVPTASAIVLLALGVLLSEPHGIAMRLLLSPAAGGHLARRLTPTAIAVPLALDLVRIVLVDTGTVDARTADWLFLVSVTTVLAAVILRLSGRLDVAHRGRMASDVERRQSAALARSMTHHANAAIIRSDAEGAIALFNPAAERLFGLTEEEAIGRPVRSLMPQRMHARHDAWRSAFVAGGAPPTDSTVELVGLTSDGEEFDGEVAFAAVPGDDAGFIGIIRDVTQAKRLERATRDDAQRLTRVVEAQSVIAATSGGVAEVMRAVAEQACEVVGGDGAVVELPDGSDLVYRATVGAVAAHRGVRVPIGTSLAGVALRTGRTMHCRDAQTDPRVDREIALQTGVRSLICVPLRQRETVIGVLKVVAGRPDAFDERDERTLELVAGLGGPTVHRAQSDGRLLANHVLSRGLAEATSLDGGVAGALRGLGESLGWELAALWLAAEDGDELRCQDVWHGATVPAAPYARACRTAAPQRGEGILGKVWGACRPSWLEEPTGRPVDDADVRRAAAAAESGLRTVVDVPVVARGQALGVLEIASREHHAFDPDVDELLAVVAAQLGQFVSRTRAQDRVAEQAANLSSVVELAQRVSRLRDPALVRPALCGAMRDILRADQVAIFEPVADGLRLTAQAGGNLGDGLTVGFDGPSAVAGVHAAGTGRYIPDAAVPGSADPQVARDTGLRSAYIEPLLRDGEVVGVVSISWHAVLRADPADLRSLVQLLVSETAGALERADLVAALDAGARTDQLTGVPNRRAWDEELPRELARSLRGGMPLCVAILDLDHFKAYNDQHGHPAGDRLLRESAAGWADRLRDTDLLCRYGGEEFAVLLPGCREHIAGAVLEDLRRAMPGGVTCSIGVAEWNGNESAEALVARADVALYAAKGDGRDRVSRATLVSAAGDVSGGVPAS
jgi:diguanylate cyclase (GGDEF)-like protein/PAS domain S-box-containing protein